MKDERNVNQVLDEWTEPVNEVNMNSMAATIRLSFVDKGGRFPGDNRTYTAEIIDGGDLSTRDLADSGVKLKVTAKSGYEALEKMVQNWKNTGYLD